MKKRFFTAAIACVAALSLSVSAFAADPGATNGKVESTQTGITAETPVKIETDLGLSIDAPAGTFAASVTEVTMNADVQATNNSSSAAVAETVADVASTSVTVNTKISVTLTDQDGNPIEPVNGKVTVTVAYDGVSNAVAYVNGNVVEFLKLAINGAVASFDASHFSDYYLVTLDNVDAVEYDKPLTANGGSTNAPSTDDKNQNTGVVIAIVPAIAAAAAVVISKKRK